MAPEGRLDGRPWLAVVGIGENGWDGLCDEARAAIRSAEVLVGASRQLALVPHTGAERIPWPSPMLPFVDVVVERYRSRAVTVLASGDPMLYGVGAVFAERLDAREMRVIPHVSAFALACARLGWRSDDVALVSAVARPLEALYRYLQPGRKVVVYSQDGATPGKIAELLRECGYGRSRLTVLQRLEGRGEARLDRVAAGWDAPEVDDLNVVALTCIADPGVRPLALVPGLPDDAFETDGQLTKRDVRAATLARLVPLPGQLLWDVGAGSGSIGIEWMRANPGARCIAIERDAQHVQFIARNARRLGVPQLSVVQGAAPSALAALEPPDAVFIGGGLMAERVVETCWEALRRGGRLVANAVTIESEGHLVRWQATLGGELVRIAVSHAEGIGRMRCWRPSLPITQWAVTK